MLAALAVPSTALAVNAPWLAQADELELNAPTDNQGQYYVARASNPMPGAYLVTDAEYAAIVAGSSALAPNGLYTQDVTDFTTGDSWHYARLYTASIHVTQDLFDSLKSSGDAAGYSYTAQVGYVFAGTADGYDQWPSYMRLDNGRVFTTDDFNSCGGGCLGLLPRSTQYGSLTTVDQMPANSFLQDGSQVPSGVYDLTPVTPGFVDELQLAAAIGLALGGGILALFVAWRVLRRFAS